MIRVEQIPDHSEVREKLRKILLGLYQKMEAQGWQQSRRPESKKCLYRGPAGLCCMVGHLVPLEQSVPEMSVLELLAEDCTASRTLIGLNPGLQPLDWGDILSDFQLIHDDSISPQHMKDKFLGVARTYLGQPLFKETP